MLVGFGVPWCWWPISRGSRWRSSCQCTSRYCFQRWGFVSSRLRNDTPSCRLRLSSQSCSFGARFGDRSHSIIYGIGGILGEKIVYHLSMNWRIICRAELFAQIFRCCNQLLLVLNNSMNLISRDRVKMQQSPLCSKMDRYGISCYWWLFWFLLLLYFMIMAPLCIYCRCCLYRMGDRVRWLLVHRWQLWIWCWWWDVVLIVGIRWRFW
jgi:hypothetical protein